LFLPYNIFFTRVILPEPLATTFSLIGLWFFVLWIDKEKDSWLFLSGVWLALSLLIKPYYLVFLLPLLYLVVHKHGLEAVFSNGKLAIKLAVFLNIVVLPFFLWRIWINQYPAGIPFFEWAFNGDKIRFRPAFWRWLFSERLAKLILGSWGLPLFFLGVIRKEIKERFIGYYLLAMFVYVSVVATANVRHDYYQIFTIPAISLALGAGTDLILRGKMFSKSLSLMAFVFLVLMSLGTGAYQVKEFYKINHPEIITAGQAVQRLTPKDARVIVPYNGDTAFLYQTDRFGWPAVDTDFKKLINERGADYYVTVTPEDKDSRPHIGQHTALWPSSPLPVPAYKCSVKT